MKRVMIILAVFMTATTFAQGEIRFTLQQCIDSAIKNNIEVQQRSLLQDAALINKNQAKQNLLPSLNANVTHGINQGRSIDPFTNAFVNQTINFANYNLGSDVVLFNGFNLRNVILQASYASDAARFEWQQSKDVITLSVILAYLQVLNNQDLTEMARQQVAVTQQQVVRLEKLNREGAISPPQLYDLRGQLKEGEVNVINSRNAWRLALLQLTQLMNIPFSENITLQKIDQMEALVPYALTVGDVFQKALEQMGVVKAAEYRRKSAAYNIKAIKGLQYPTLFLTGNINSNYSSAALQERFINTSEEPTSNFVIVNGNKVPVVVKQNNYAFDKISYTNQLRNNIFSGLGLGIRVPIFNSFQTRNRVKLATIEYKSALLVEENVQRQLRQEVEQAYLNMQNAWERYEVTKEQVAAFAESFRAAEVRFNAGVGNSIDYMLAKNNLDRANLSLIMTRYDFLLRRQILDYYVR